MKIFRWWRKSSLATKLLLSLFLLAGAWTAWWWADSAHCDRQDEFTLRGICLIQIRNSAEQGQVPRDVGRSAAELVALGKAIPEQLAPDHDLVYIGH